MPICIKLITDPVYTIRERACKIMKRLYDIFKGEDFKKKLLTKINLISKSDNYLIRITSLLLIREFLVNEYELDFMEKNYFLIYQNYQMIKYLMSDKLVLLL